MNPEECLRRFGSHNMIVQPGGARQVNPYTGKSSTLKTQICLRCGTSSMFFVDDDDDDDSSEETGGGGFRCPNCGEVDGHADWCPWA